MSPLLTAILNTAGGVLAGIACLTLPLLRQRRALHIARHQAGHDDTTGLPNRRTLLTALGRAQHRDRPFGLVLLDLNRFKAVNDTYGHEAGNDLLIAVGQRLTSLPIRAMAARLSGDEFALLVDGGPDEVGNAARHAASVIAAEPFALPSGAQVAIRASVGYTTGRVGVPVRDLLREADAAVYWAKDGIDDVSRYHPDVTTPGNTRQRCRDRR
ncbi:GGDEF domain-containing protein [Dactylosporangium sp. NPDC000244]|uniref:GGDEF domain-containing protein n=1 Tax=Dactylosporangium sp. NPDC000244 TaxID=3154365 RepID=UPI00333045C4